MEGKCSFKKFTQTVHGSPARRADYLVGHCYTNPKLMPAPSMLGIIGIIFQMFTVKLA